MKVLSSEEVSIQLKKSLRWVYHNAGDLGAARIGGSWIFTEEGLENALQRGQEVARLRDAQRTEASRVVSIQKGRARMGGGETAGAEKERQELAKRHGFDSFLR